MANTYWYKQSDEVPLFPELAWSKPENKRYAGKLLIVGGNLHGFAAMASGYQAADAAAAGVIRIVLPDAIKKVAGGIFDQAFFAPSTPSGSFSRRAVATIIEQADWSDGVLMAGDIGRNSETVMAMDDFVHKYKSQVTLVGDAIDIFKDTTDTILKRPDTTLVTTVFQFQKIAQKIGSETAITSGMPLLKLVDYLHEFTKLYSANIVVVGKGNTIAASNGRVSTTRLNAVEEAPATNVAAAIAVWWLQNPSKDFEAITAAIFSVSH